MRVAAAAVGLALAPASLAAAPEFTTQNYTCDRGVEVPATYINAAEGSLVVLTVEGRQITLVNEPAASGARYGWPSGGSNYVWWTKGDGATLLWRTPEAEAALLTCTAAS
jgi:membrane-bound inhibitor of C-type lysozyme